MTPLWIVSMDRRTIYASRDHAEEVVKIASGQLPRYTFEAIWTGDAWTIIVKEGTERVGWIFDGEFSRS